jgi:ubiquitin-protein ligase
MALSPERVLQDLRKIDELSNSLRGRIRTVSSSGSPVNQIFLEINYPTAPSKDYPQKIQHKTSVKIELLARYPFQEPVATITTPIFHPNVYSSGKICFGTKWLPTQGLDLLVRRIIQIITFDETILNEISPANSKALTWYKQAVLINSNAFPTEKFVLQQQTRQRITWNNI